MRCPSPPIRAFVLAAAFAAALGAARAAPPFASPASPKLSSADVLQNLMPSVAHIQAFSTDSSSGIRRFEQASGFVIDRYKRLVLTSCHVLFAEWSTLSIEIELGAQPALKRAADALLCDRTIDLAIVRVRQFDIEFPRALRPPLPRDMRLDDGLYVLGFASLAPAVIPATLEARDVNVPGLGSFIRTRSDFPPSQPGASSIEDAQHDLSDLRGGPLVDAQGRLVGVNAFSSEGRVTHPLSGVEIAEVPKGLYYARTIESIADFVRRGLALNP
jgi:S1-C subfamily serine protease